MLPRVEISEKNLCSVCSFSEAQVEFLLRTKGFQLSDLTKFLAKLYEIEPSTSLGFFYLFISQENPSNAGKSIEQEFKTRAQTFLGRAELPKYLQACLNPEHFESFIITQAQVLHISIESSASFCGLLTEEINELEMEFSINRSLLFGMFKSACEQKKGIVQFYFELATTLMNCAAPLKARHYFEKLLDWKFDADFHSMYLMNLVLSPDTTNEILKNKSAVWGKYFEEPILVKKPPKRILKRNRRIRVGYICSFFGNSVMQNGLVAMLKHHDRSKFEIHCYSDTRVDPSLFQIVENWHEVGNLSDYDLAKKIDSDEIDILQELNGHVVGNRLRCLAYRPSPIQVNWANTTATMGLENIDYVIADRFSIRREEACHYHEKLYLNSCYLYATDYSAFKFPCVSRLPSDVKAASQNALKRSIKRVLKESYITFGYFGAMHKVNDFSIEIWSEVLRRTPGSIFFLKASALDHKIFRDAILRTFRKNGIREKRIIFAGFSDFELMLEEYSFVDIMLDSYPHTGGSTMIEAIWQGVLPVTILGDRWSSRTGAAILVAAGLPECVAQNSDEFVDKACDFAKNQSLLRQYRAGMRDLIRGSSLFDVQRFASDLEKAYSFFWLEWCELNGSKRLR